MALYLGSNKVTPIVTKYIEGSGTKCLKGTVTSDSNGVVTFPELDFTPNIITIWNISEMQNDR